MTKAEILDKLHTRKPMLAERFAVTGLALPCSVPTLATKLRERRCALSLVPTWVPFASRVCHT